MKLPGNTQKSVRLNTQEKRAAFVERELRSQGWGVIDFAAECELAWSTVYNFIDGTTKFPRMETVVKIFRILGYDVVFQARQSKGEVRIAA
jgi:predicted transcriptional regulator